MNSSIQAIHESANEKWKYFDVFYHFFCAMILECDYLSVVYLSDDLP